VACDFRSQEKAAALAVGRYAEAGFSPAAAYGSQASALYYGPLPVAAAVRRCTELLASSPDRMTEANVTAVLGALHGLHGDIGEARTSLDQARSAYDDLGQRSTLETILAPLAADVERMAGNTEEAVRICRASFDALADTGNRAFASTRAVNLAELLLDLGRADEAEYYVLVAEEQAIRSDVLVQFLRRSQRARLLGREGRHPEAESVAREAVAISSLTDALMDRARTHVALAEVLAAAGGRAEARRESAEARRLLAEKGLNAKESLSGSLSPA
jgi:tetratricopeptide (TPR) repeat protein